jgi:hypothetical protein
MNDASFPICSHPGIIVLSGGRRHESIHADIFQRFILSGKRKEAKDAVTFLTEDSARIKKHLGEATIKI